MPKSVLSHMLAMCLSCASHVIIMHMSGEWTVHEEETRAAEDMDVEQHTMAADAEVCVPVCAQVHLPLPPTHPPSPPYPPPLLESFLPPSLPSFLPSHLSIPSCSGLRHTLRWWRSWKE